MERAQKFPGRRARSADAETCSPCGTQEGGAGPSARLVVQQLQALLHARLERAAHGERHAGHQRRRHRRHGRKARERGLGCHGGGDGRGGAEAAAAAAAARRRAPPAPPGTAQPRSWQGRLCRAATVQALHVRSSLSPCMFTPSPQRFTAEAVLSGPAGMQSRPRQPRAGARGRAWAACASGCCYCCCSAGCCCWSCADGGARGRASGCARARRRASCAATCARAPPP